MNNEIKKYVFLTIAKKESLNQTDFDFIMTGYDSVPIMSPIYKNYKHVKSIVPPPQYKTTFLSERYESFIFSLYNSLHKFHKDLEEALDKIKFYKYGYYADKVDMKNIYIFYCLCYLKLLNYYSSNGILTLSEFESKFTKVLKTCNTCIIESKKLLNKIT